MRDNRRPRVAESLIEVPTAEEASEYAGLKSGEIDVDQVEYL